MRLKCPNSSDITDVLARIEAHYANPLPQHDAHVRSRAGLLRAAMREDRDEQLRWDAEIDQRDGGEP